MLVVAGALVAIAGLALMRRPLKESPDTTELPSSSKTASSASLPTDEVLRRAVDELIEAVNPDLPENNHFPEFARSTLRWMSQEQAAGRLTVVFVSESEGDIPPTVMMLATQLDGRAAIAIAKPGFAAFLLKGARQTAPFSQQQKNDFAIALMHETFHIQNWVGNPKSDEERALVETQAWHAVNMGVVRPWRALNQPMDPRFLIVDDGFLSCADRLPCPAVARMVRTAPR